MHVRQSRDPLRRYWNDKKVGYALLTDCFEMQYRFYICTSKQGFMSLIFIYALKKACTYIRNDIPVRTRYFTSKAVAVILLN